MCCPSHHEEGVALPSAEGTPGADAPTAIHQGVRMQYRSPRRHTFLALLGAAGLVAGSGVAAAQVGPMALPGTNDDVIQIAVGHEDLAHATLDEVEETSEDVTWSGDNTSH